MKKKSFITLLLVALVVLTLTVVAVQADSESDAYFKKLLSCSSSGVYYEDQFEPFLEDPRLVGGDEWNELVAYMRSDNGITCGYISSRPPEESLEDYADDLYDAAHFTTVGLEFRVLAFENPKIADLLNAEADGLLTKADELFGKILSEVDLG